MKNKLYRASITLPNGKRKWIRSVSQEGLEQKKQELLTQIGAGLDVSNNSTFGEYAALWLRVYKVPYLRQNSLLAIENALNNHIYPYLRDVPLKKVNQIQIQLVIASVSKMSKSLNNKVVQVLRGIFNAAVDNNLIAKSPVPAILPNRRQSNAGRRSPLNSLSAFWTRREERGHIFSACWHFKPVCGAESFAG